MCKFGRFSCILGGVGDLRIGGSCTFWAVSGGPRGGRGRGVPFGVGLRCGGEGRGVVGWWEWGVGHKGVGGEPRGWDWVEVRGVGGGEEVGGFRVGSGGVRVSVRFARWGVLGGGSYLSIV